MIPPRGAKRFFGTHHNMGALNCSDMQRDTAVGFPFKSAILKQANGINSYWANQVLTSDQGIDFNGNPSDHDDPDQVTCPTDHDPYALLSAHIGAREANTNNVSHLLSSCPTCS